MEKFEKDCRAMFERWLKEVIPPLKDGCIDHTDMRVYDALATWTELMDGVKQRGNS